MTHSNGVIESGPLYLGRWTPFTRTTFSKAVYWSATALLAMAFLSGGVRHLMQAPDVVSGIMALGYPLYFILLLGVWKLLGGITILMPGVPRLKEWAYAGMFFDLTGAAVSHAARGGPTWHLFVTLTLAGVVLVSWHFRPNTRKL